MFTPSNKVKRLIAGTFICLLFLGGCPLLFSECMAAKAKPKVIRKVHKKAPKKIIRKKSVKRIKHRAPKGPQIISQNYFLEESPDEIEAEVLAAEVKDLGAGEVNVDSIKNVLHVKYNADKLTAVRIIQKLKDLGYTVKRIQ